MICKGINNFFCVARGLGELRNADLFCALCPAENKIVPTLIIKKLKCVFAKETQEPFRGCRTCQATVIECQHEKQYPKKRNSNTCNSTCKFFSPVDDMSNKTINFLE